MTEERPESFGAKPWHAKVSRRGFVGTSAALAGAAGLAGYLPDSLLRAAASSAATGTSFDLSQIKHLVFLMQENRSFDHYFGTFPRVRGFSDPDAIKFPNGRTVFQQPDPTDPDGYLEPFHISTITTGSAATPSLSHNWQPQHTAWNQGQMDGWLRAHLPLEGYSGSYTMGYYTQQDIPFHWALAEAFTLLDGYHCSVLGPTYPNRLLWMTGTNDPQGLAGGPSLETTFSPWSWTTAPEVLLSAGYTFKVYQPANNAATNVLTSFTQITGAATDSALYQGCLSISTLWGDGTPGGVGDPTNPTPASNPNLAFQEDCANGVLPDVSWIMPYGPADEHPPAIPALGAQFMAALLEALASSEDLWNTTVFVIQYDENDGFFDHVPPPVPDREQFPEEFVTGVSPPGTPGLGYPVGGGFRVPCFIVSPWSVGGKIFSGVSDHTSCLRLIEAVAAAGGLSGRGPVHFSKVSPWRREAFGDLTGALMPGAPQPAPSSPQFDPATTAANLASQEASATLPLAAIPGADQTMPVQVTTT